MTEIRRDDLLRLLAAIPAPDAYNEVILRPDGDVPLAMLRPAGQPPRAFVLQDGAAVELLPENDPDLPASKLFGKKSRMLRALQPLLGPVEEPKLVAWRPGKRAVVRVKLGDGALFVKFLDRKTYRRAAGVFEALPMAVPPMEFARATQLLGELCAYVAPAAPGVCLREILAKGERPSWALLDDAIRALAATPVHAGMPVVDFATAKDAGVRMLQKGAVMVPELAARAERLAALGSPSSVRRGFVHGDFHDRQVFLTNDRVHLIDLETVGSGDANFDLINMAEQVRLRSLQQNGSDDGTGAALLERFGVEEDVRWRWGVCVRARLCGVYALRPRWAELVRRLLSEVDGMLARG